MEIDLSLFLRLQDKTMAPEEIARKHRELELGTAGRSSSK
jgi:hypothetical protein